MVLTGKKKDYWLTSGKFARLRESYKKIGNGEREEVIKCSTSELA